MDPEKTKYILVTGCNSGLGFGICQRLIDEYLSTRQESHCLHLIVTTRSSRKAKDTVDGLHKWLRQGRHGPKAIDRVTIQPESLELSSLLSVRALAKKLLNSSLPRIDAAILNAGTWGVFGLNWPKAIWDCLTDLVHSVTFPAFHRTTTGALAPSQFPNLPADAPKELLDAPPLGDVFTSNVFGHYMLMHELMPLLRASSTSSCPSPSRIIWVGSCDASDMTSLDDLQGFRALSGYDNSKRVTDVLALTATRPGSAKHVNQFFTPNPITTTPGDDHHHHPSVTQSPPAILLSHPGLLSSNIISVPFPLPFFWGLALYFARLLGSPWHNVQPYTAAIAPVFLALASFEIISRMNSARGPEGGGVGKWGSSCLGFRGVENVRRTFVPGYGGGGRHTHSFSSDTIKNGAADEDTALLLSPSPPLHVPIIDEDIFSLWGFADGTMPTTEGNQAPPQQRKDRYSRYTGRRRTAVRPTEEDIEQFYIDGAEIWDQIERLRTEWTGRLELYERFHVQRSVCKDKVEG